MADSRITVLDLPQDILDIIFLFLEPRSFLGFCSITRQFWRAQCRSPTYWRVATSTTFRIPISPLLRPKGDRWYWLYKKLRTQTKAFTWGQGNRGALGLPLVPRVHRRVPGPAHAPAPNGVTARLTNLVRRQRADHTPDEQIEVMDPDWKNHAWPSKMDVPPEVGIIADLQCGGWSTTLLSSRGELYSVGILDMDNGLSVGRTYERLTRLDYWSRTPIKSFSAGRKHVLGLDEAGHVWSWDRIDVAAWQIYDVTALDASLVVGGWSVSSAYTKDGIVYWRVPKGISGEGSAQARMPPGSDSLGKSGLQSEAEAGHESREFVKTTVIPGTGFRSQQQQQQSDTQHPIGQVMAYIVLEAYIVFITDSAKVFAYRIVNEAEAEADAHMRELSFELPAFSAPDRQLKHIQGSFRTFSVFTDAEEVLSGDQDYIDRVYACRKAAPPDVGDDELVAAMEPGANDIDRPEDVKALQQAGVISVAYGDYHFHALHSDGQITSYGREPQGCGALGLGEASSGARFRGVKFGRPNIWARDARLLPIGYKQGREMWFSRSQKAWLGKLESLVRTPEDYPQHHPSFEIINEQEDRQGAYSEWVEREGRAWEESVKDEDGLRSYFAISVAAAGWHSAALVLENSELADQVERSWLDTGGRYKWEKGGFPRISLPDGFEFPGAGELREWKGGMPSIDELGISDRTET